MLKKTTISVPRAVSMEQSFALLSYSRYYCHMKIQLFRTKTPTTKSTERLFPTSSHYPVRAASPKSQIPLCTVAQMHKAGTSSVQNSIHLTEPNQAERDRALFCTKGVERLNNLAWITRKYMGGRGQVSNPHIKPLNYAIPLSLSINKTRAGCTEAHWSTSHRMLSR